MAGVPSAPMKLWIPGQGDLDLTARRVSRAIRQYDENLKLGRHELTGDWVVLHERGPEGKPYPVFGFGKELPHPDQVEQILGRHDVARNGDRIMDDLAAASARREQEDNAAYDAVRDDAIEQLGHWLGRDRGVRTRIFIP